MALINCPECNNEVSDKANSCPKCGCPIQPTKSTDQNKEDDKEYIFCPNCLSNHLHSEQKGFSGGKALAGAVLAGGIGLLAGTIGSKKVDITCLKCKHKFKAGEGLICTNEGKDKLIEETKKYTFREWINFCL